MNKKKILILTFLILLVGIIACIGIFTNTDKKNNTPKKTTTTKTTNNISSPVLITVVLEINPKLALELNDQEIVVNMYPLNDDAKQFTREAYIGKSLEDSIEKVMEDAENYIDKNQKITVSVTKGETSFTDSKIENIQSKVVSTIKKENEKVQVEEKVLTSAEIVEVIDIVKEIKIEDKKQPATTTTTTTENTTTTKTTIKKTTTTKKSTSTKVTTKTTTTKKPDYNLNDNIKFEIGDAPLGMIYIYPTNSECKGKYPMDITLPEGETYNNYCKNNIPKQSTIKGKGYYCEPTSDGMLNDDGITSNKPYKCTWIKDIISSSTILEKINKVIKTSDAIEMGGGAGGGGEEIILDEAACEKYSLSCGRW